MGETLDRMMLCGHLETLVLAELARADLHGYGLRWRLGERSHGEFQVAYGRLYPLLRALEKRRCVASRLEPSGPVRRRRVFTLTPCGRERLDFLRLKWSRFATGVDRVLGDEPRRISDAKSTP